jgi:hypothetical protein
MSFDMVKFANTLMAGPKASEPYRWRKGDVFTNGKYRWKVIKVSDDGDTAVLQSCSTEWATTRWLTFDEWHEHGRSGFALEA